MKQALRWALSNLTMALLALVMALMAWVAATESADPTRTERYFIAIPVFPVGLAEDMTIVGEVHERVRVTVRAPESVWESITAEDFTATVDLSGLGEGVYRLPIQVELREKPSQVTWEPRTVDIELARRAEREVPVRVLLDGEPAVGHLAHTPTSTPLHVTVTGPAPYVTRVVEAVATASVQDASASVEENVELEPLDSEGNPVPYVILTPSQARVVVPIVLSEEYRTLTVSPVRVGLPAPGYMITGFAVDPETVTVSGPADAIASLPGYIETEAINVEGAQANVVVRQRLNAPPNVAIVSNPHVTVTFYVEAIQSSLIIEITPTIQNLERGLVATVSPATVEVFLSGPLPQLDALQPEDVQIVLDLVGLLRGVHLIEIRPEEVIAPEGLTVRSVLPAAVQVEIRSASTPTPRSSSNGN